jgi:SAM-dependent methyltransferase
MKPANSTWPEYIRNGLGWKISKFGEKIGCGWMIYNPVVMECFHSLALQNAPKVVGSMAAVFPAVRSVVDVGCGSGAFAAEFIKRGYQVIGCEHSAYGRKLAAQQGVNVIKFDLNRTPPVLLVGTFDLAYSFEVVEHLPPILGDKLVHFLTQLSSLVVFTAAQSGQGGVGHINEQPLNYWIEKFRQRGHELDQVATAELKARFEKSGAATWFSANVCVFRKSQEQA